MINQIEISMHLDWMNRIYWNYIRANSNEYDLTKHAYRDMLFMINIRAIQGNYFEVG